MKSAATLVEMTKAREAMETYLEEEENVKKFIKLYFNRVLKDVEPFG